MSKSMLPLHSTTIQKFAEYATQKANDIHSPQPAAAAFTDWPELTSQKNVCGLGQGFHSKKINNHAPIVACNWLDHLLKYIPLIGQMMSRDDVKIKTKQKVENGGQTFFQTRKFSVILHLPLAHGGSFPPFFLAYKIRFSKYSGSTPCVGILYTYHSF